MIAALGATFIVGLIFLGVVALFVWLIVRRIREKENETFEKRDN
jgi:hypothetical protein